MHSEMPVRLGHAKNGRAVRRRLDKPAPKPVPDHTAGLERPNSLEMNSIRGVARSAEYMHKHNVKLRSYHTPKRAQARQAATAKWHE